MRQLVDLHVQVTGGPPPGPTSPSPASWIRVPLSTPAGILTVSVLRERTRPSPAHSGHGFGTMVPKPWHCGHGLDVMTWPRKDRVTCETSPRPRHMSQVCAEVPGAAPSPLQVLQTTAVSTWMSLVVPKAASSSSISSRIMASWPRRVRERGPRCDAVPKKASMMSEKFPKPPAPKPPAPAPPAWDSGSPPRS